MRVRIRQIHKVIIIYDICIKSRFSGGRARTGVRVYKILLRPHYYIIICISSLLCSYTRFTTMNATQNIMYYYYCVIMGCVAIMRVSLRHFVEEYIIIIILNVYLQYRLFENSLKYIRTSHV